MTDKDENQPKAKNGLYIGARCKLIRKELGLTQGDILEKTSADNQATISNLENKGMIGDWLWEYIDYLYQEGFNPAWIIIENNSTIPMRIGKGKGEGVKFFQQQMKSANDLTKTILENSVNLNEILKEIQRDAPSGLNNL